MRSTLFQNDPMGTLFTILHAALHAMQATHLFKSVAIA